LSHCRSDESCAETVGYASLCEEAQKFGSDLKILNEFMNDIPNEVDIMAEDVHPRDYRFLWNSLVDFMTEGRVKIAVMSCLYDVAGDDTAELETFLQLAEEKQVRVRFLKEQLDTDRHSLSEIVSFATRTFSTKKRSKFVKINWEFI
jgi:hypothetical protein